MAVRIEGVALGLGAWGLGRLALSFGLPLLFALSALLATPGALLAAESGGAEAEPAHRQARVALLAKDDAILEGRLIGLQDGYFRLEQSESILEISPRAIVGIFPDRESALTHKAAVEAHRALVAESQRLHGPGPYPAPPPPAASRLEKDLYERRRGAEGMISTFEFTEDMEAAKAVAQDYHDRKLATQRLRQLMPATLQTLGNPRTLLDPACYRPLMLCVALHTMTQGDPRRLQKLIGQLKFTIEKGNLTAAEELQHRRHFGLLQQALGDKAVDVKLKDKPSGTPHPQPDMR